MDFYFRGPRFTYIMQKKTSYRFIELWSVSLCAVNLYEEVLMFK